LESHPDPRIGSMRAQTQLPHDRKQCRERVLLRGDGEEGAWSRSFSGPEEHGGPATTTTTQIVTESVAAAHMLQLLVCFGAYTLPRGPGVH